MIDVAQNCAKAWRGQVNRLISHRENAVFEMQLPNGDLAALRLHRVGYNSIAAIKEEMQWTLKLTDAGFPCPSPIPTIDGNLILQHGQMVATCVSWVPYPAIGDTDWTKSQRKSLFWGLGELLGQLHRLTDQHSIRAPNRHSWDQDGLLSSNATWGQFWTVGGLSPSDTQVLKDARATAGDWLTAHPEFSQGLIHADALKENVMGSPENLWLIDFDDAGNGYHLYDLGVAVAQQWDAPDLPDITAALIEGYQTSGPKDPTITFDNVLRFMALRSFASCGWSETRTEAGSPDRQRHIDRAVSCARRYFPT